MKPESRKQELVGKVVSAAKPIKNIHYMGNA